MLVAIAYQVTTYLAGPGQQTALTWEAELDSIDIKLDTERLRTFYASSEWNLAFVCEPGEFDKHRPSPDTFLAFAPIESGGESLYRIFYPGELSERLELTTFIRCKIAAVRQELNLTKQSPLTKRGENVGYEGVLLSERILGSEFTFESAVLTVLEREFAAVGNDICACSMKYPIADSLPQ